VNEWNPARLKQAREKAGWSLGMLHAAFIRACSDSRTVTRETLSNWEDGTTVKGPDAAALLVLAKVFDCAPEWFCEQGK
jgi:transcriptional regulator with XRE-family HTH domain